MKGLILALLLPTSLFAAQFDPSTLIVKMKGDYRPDNGLISKSQRLFGSVYVVTTQHLAALENELQSDERVVYVEKNYKAGKRAMPKMQPIVFSDSKDSRFDMFTDPLTSKIWSFNDASAYGVSVNKAYANPINSVNEQIIVAVVDTGVDYNHEDLKAVMWKNPGEIPGNGIDDDGNGYVDDIYGINTIDHNSNPMDTYGHGTHVSGTIGAKQNNGIGISGIASNVRIMAVRAVPNDGDETDVNVVESYIYAAKNGARIINCSFGKQVNEGGMAVHEAIDFIGKNYGVLVVAAAGNDYQTDIDTNPRWPASYDNDNLLVIAATSSNGSLASFSNVGKKNVDLAAPGNNIYSTTPGNRYANMSGTSMATPTTVGVAAEVLSHFPALSGVELKDVLMKSVTKVPKFQNLMVTGGRVDLYNALQLAQTHSH